MSVRLIRLYIRSRAVPTALVGIGVAAAYVWVLRDSDGVVGLEAMTALLMPMLGAVVIGPTLAGHDDGLDASTAAPWQAIRLAHLLTATTLLAGALAGASLNGPTQAFLIRNSAGFTGFIAGAAVLVGARLAWLPLFGYALTILVAGASGVDRPDAVGQVMRIWSWPVMPSDNATSWCAALGVLVLDGGLFVRSGYPISRSRRAASFSATRRSRPD